MPKRQSARQRLHRSIPRDARAPRGALAGSNRGPAGVAPRWKNCQPTPQPKVTTPQNKPLPRQNPQKSLARFLSPLGILKIGGEEIPAPPRSHEKGRQTRPFSLPEGTYPHAGLRRRLAPHHDLGTGHVRSSKSCQVSNSSFHSQKNYLQQALTRKHKSPGERSTNGESTPAGRPANNPKTSAQARIDRLG
jgi:hypothetical protein